MKSVIWNNTQIESRLRLPSSQTVEYRTSKSVMLLHGEILTFTALRPSLWSQD
jgi:hypothetical protein